MLSFLNRKYLTKVRNRTFTQTVTEDQTEFKITADGAWRIEVYNIGNKDCFLRLQDSAIPLRANVPTNYLRSNTSSYYIFEGSPQVMRNDEFEIEFAAGGGGQFGEVLIVYNRLVKEGGDKQLGDNIYTDIKVE